jgi:hypothetical protein
MNKRPDLSEKLGCLEKEDRIFRVRVGLLLESA